MKMFEFIRDPHPLSPARHRLSRSAGTSNRGSQPLRARVKQECVHLYPGVDPMIWYQVVQEGEYKDEMEGLWIQVTDWVTYVLAKHFDVQARPETN
jgi:hypothetical protein